MKVPEITHLQFLVLGVLLDGEQTGRNVREQLAEVGHPKNGPAFYQFMSRLEDAKLIEGWYDEKIVAGQRIKERVYRITADGESAWRDTQEFYAAAAQKRLGPQGA